MAYSLKQILIDILAFAVDSVASQSSLGGRVYLAGSVGDNPELPYIAMEMESTDEIGRTIDGKPGAQQLQISFHVHARTQVQVVGLGDSLIENMTGFQGVKGQTNIGMVTLEDQTIFYDENSKTYRYVIDTEINTFNN